MATTEHEFNERVVKVVETCDGDVTREFYGIYDRDFGHWMSEEPFDGLIWTKDVHCRQEFASRLDAEDELDKFLEWREERAAKRNAVDEIPFVDEAA